MPVGHFLAGVAAVIWSPAREQYLLLRRSEAKDYAAGVWECLTGRVDQGEGYADALHREVREELGFSIQAAHILGTTHFYRGAPSPENELLGVVYLCLLDETKPISLSPEHSEFRWLTARQSLELLSASDPSTRWARRVIERAEAVRPLLSGDLIAYQIESDFELG
jgi:8-oxo-dGTP diphosphatase